MQLSERSELFASPHFQLRNWEPEGQLRLRRLLCLLFLAKQEKRSGRRATPASER